MKKKFFVLAMCLILVMAVLPSVASAEGEDGDSSAQASYTPADGSDTTETGTFEAMLKEANDNGGTVTLLQDVNLGEGESATITGTVTLDLNGHEIANSLKTTTDDRYIDPRDGKAYTCVSNDDAKWTIEIQSNGNLTLKDSQAGTDLPGNIKNGVTVKSNATFTMESGSISNSEYLNGVTVASNAIFTMNGGIISNNHSAGRNGGGVYNNGTFVMNNGEISNNTAYYIYEIRGGGVYSESNFTMNNGTISGNKVDSMNTSVNGGGVYIDGAQNNNMTFTMNGGVISGNIADYQGGGVYIQGGAYYGKVNTYFYVNGGEISENRAISGGGIYISWNASVTISKGYIKNNHADRTGGGIGIYNNTLGTDNKTSEYSAGELHLTNVVITNNYVEEYIQNGRGYGPYGGGIASCPTSSTYIYLTDGGAIYGNDCKYGELFVQPISSSVNQEHVLYLSRYMLGGGSYDWQYVEDGSEVEADAYIDLSDYFIATNSVTADSPEAQAANALAKVFITGNTAYYTGGGIMNNGILEIGTSDASLRVEKQENGLGTASYTFSASFWTEDEDTNATMPYTDEITYLGSATKGIQKVTPEDGKVTFTLSKGDYIVFYDLDDGVHYKVEETSKGTYTTAYIGDQQGALSKEKTASVVVENTYPTGDLTITKKVENKNENDDLNEAFAFTLTIKDEKGIAIPGIGLLSVTRSGDSDSDDPAEPTTDTLSFDEAGKATFTLTDGDSITITLPAGTQYTIEEIETKGYKSAITEGNATGTIIADQTITVVITNTPADPETPTTPTDPGKPSKPVNPPALNTEDHVGYIIGYPDGTVRPEGNITRAETVTIFFRMLTEEVRDQYWSQENPYSDVAKTAWYNNAISTLSKLGIVDGYPDGSFRPDASITRAEFTKIAVSFFEYADENFTYDGEFSDVTGSEWYASFVAAADAFGLIEGYPDGTFLPENPIIRAEACTIVNRTLGRAPAADHLLDREEMITWPDNLESAWYYAQMQEATNSHDYRWTKEASEDTEQWTEKLEERNWEALEKVWSTSHSAPGGEVVD